MALLEQDERSSRLHGNRAVWIDKDKYNEFTTELLELYHTYSDYFNNNFRDDFVKYYANFKSIAADVIKPWPDANEYFMPSSNIVVENYVAREMESIKGGRNFLTVLPRGKDDADKARIIQHMLRYVFEVKMNGQQKIVNFKRNRFIYGTAVAYLPWTIDRRKELVPGTFIYDKGINDWIREMPQENTLENPPPKDFSGLDVKEILKLNKDYVLKDLTKKITFKDQPDLEIVDPFCVKLDPNGGQYMENHQGIFFERTERLDTILRKADIGFYDMDEVKKLKQWYNDGGSNRINNRGFANDTRNDAQRYKDSVEGKDQPPVNKGLNLIVYYGRFDIEGDGYEEEIIAVIAEGKFLLKLLPTPFRIKGVPYRPIALDHFIGTDRPYGIGICQILEQLNYLLNHLVNQILNHGDLYNSPPLIYPAEGVWNPNDYIWGPGQSWASDNADGFKFLATPDIKSSQVQMITFIEGFIQKCLGINDYTLGSGSGSIVNNQTAHGLANIIREANRRIDFYASCSHHGGLKDIYMTILKECQQFMDEVEIPKITDIDAGSFDFSTIMNSDIQGLFDIDIYADSLTASKEFEQLKAQNFLNLLQLQDPKTGYPIYDSRKIGDYNITANDIPFPERFYFEPPPPQPGMEGAPAPIAGGEEGGGNSGKSMALNPENVPKEGRLGSLNP